MKYYIGRMLVILLACAAFNLLDSKLEVTGRAIEFLSGHGVNFPEKSKKFTTVDVTYCLDLKDSFSKRQLSKIDPFYYTSYSCGVVDEGFKVRKILIRSYGNIYGLQIDHFDPKDEDPDGPLKIEKVNVPHCRLQTDLNPNLVIWESCEEFEKKLEAK